VKDEEKHKWLTVAKIGTGLTDEQWREMRRRLEEQVRTDKHKMYVVDDQLEPDVWVDPEVVVEVAADEITKSPVHSAGLALRFPRLVRFRDDKDAEQATMLGELKQIK
jgi:DNA ligase-1